MVLNDVQLRSFPIDKPWARYDSPLHIPQALASWEYAQDTPELDRQPAFPTQVSILLGRLFEMIPPEMRFSIKMFGKK